MNVCRQLLSAAPQPPSVTIVAAVVSPSTHTLAAELRRDSLHVEVGSADVLRGAPAPSVYVFWFDAALGVVLADRIVEWAGGSELRAPA